MFFIFLAKNVRYLRNRIDISQETLGEKIGSNRDIIASLENERTNTQLKYVIEISLFFNTSIDDLIYKDLEEQEKQKNNI